MSQVINYDALNEVLGLGTGHSGWTEPSSLQGLLSELRLAEHLVQAKALDARIDIQDEKTALVNRVEELEAEVEKLTNPLTPLKDRIVEEREKAAVEETRQKLKDAQWFPGGPGT